MLLCIQMHIKWLTQWHLKVIASAMKQHLYGQFLHPFGATNFIISHLGSTQKASYPKPSALLVVIHHFRFSYLNYVFHVLQEVGVRYVGVISFVFHVLQLLPIGEIHNKTCVALARLQ